jgi:hypothetical protein
MKATGLRPIYLAMLMAFALMSVACGALRQAAQRNMETEEQIQLTNIGIMYQRYANAMTVGPAKVEDLDQFAFSKEEKDALQGVRSGKYKLIWKVRFLDMVEGTSNTILGYEPAAETSKGLVLFGDGRVEQLTAAKFKSTPLAKPMAN